MPSLFAHFAVLKPDLSLDQLRVTPRIYQELDERYDGFRSHALIAAHSFSKDWETWEKHPAGDELVVLLSGRAEMVFRLEHGDRSTELAQPGSYIVVPKGTWHTARIGTPTTMLFATPGAGTANERSPAFGT